ncbi:ATP-binding protein [Acrocarpospora pleiomorpha]|uniref:ATP-binding protein n=1 Tax=Acrocarpospora pleiomorpha TaxID=90975 RepID=UPI001478FE61|nr:ATP-binding protein [Acrocarpospora pleiomorpha]
MSGLGVLGAVELPGEAASVVRARVFVRGVLGRAGVDEASDVLLLVSELVTNAVAHSESGEGGRVGLVVIGCPDRIVRVEVCDQGSEASKPRVRDDQGLLATGGRGLRLVEQIARGWDWEEDGSGRTVWFEVAV